MLKNITLGQYYPMQTPIHRLDPRTKLIISIAFIALTFFLNQIWSYVAITVFLVAVMVLGKITPVMVLRSIKALWIIILFTFVLNVFFIKGETPLFDWQFIHISLEGIRWAFSISIRIVFLVIITSFLTYTTSPIEITNAIESLFSPLKRIKFPVHELAMMMSLAMRFIPTLIEETDKIMKAQTARGADFESGNIIKRAFALLPLLIPLFVSAFKRADELALAMEARCYNGGHNRTKYKILKMRKADVLSFIIAIACGTLMVVNFSGAS